MKDRPNSANQTPLRVTALLAALPIICLRADLDPRSGSVLLFLLFYCGPYLLLAGSPGSWASFRHGFAIGYAISMQPGLFLLHLSMPGPTPEGLHVSNPVCYTLGHL